MSPEITLLLQQISNNLLPLKNLNKPFLLSSEFWTMIASLTALAIAAGVVEKYIKPFFISPHLAIIGLKQLSQGKDNNIYWRLAIKNDGNEIAQLVQGDIINIIENNVSRLNFIPVPLKWTHLQNSSVIRDILPNQTVYLDLLVEKVKQAQLHIQTPINGQTDDLEVIQQKGEIKVCLYVKNGKALNIDIAIIKKGQRFGVTLK